MIDESCSWLAKAKRIFETIGKLYYFSPNENPKYPFKIEVN